MKHVRQNEVISECDEESAWTKNAIAAIEEEIGRKLTGADMRFVTLDFKQNRRRYSGHLVYEAVKRRTDKTNH